jgi:hypothetical protein
MDVLVEEVKLKKRQRRTSSVGEDVQNTKILALANSLHRDKTHPVQSDKLTNPSRNEISFQLWKLRIQTYADLQDVYGMRSR